MEDQRCAPPHLSQLDREEKRSVMGEKVGGRGQSEAEEPVSVRGLSEGFINESRCLAL